MLNFMMLTTVFGVAEATGQFDQKYFDILGGYKVVNVAHQYKDLSVNECASKCASFARDGACEVAGYHLNSQICQIAADNITAMNSDRNFVILKISEICGLPTALENEYVEISSDRQTALFSCADGYALNGTEHVHCDRGNWDGIQPSCIALLDCGTTIEAEHTNVKAVYPSGTLAGTTATVNCAPGHRSQTGSLSWNFLCDTFEKNWTTPLAPDCVWELMFRGTAKNSHNVTNAFLFGDVTDGVTSEEGCMDVHNTSCFLNYRNSKVDQWNSLDVNEVLYELYNSTSTVLQVKFNGSGSTINSWFSTSTALSYPWSIPDLTATWWDMNGPTDIMFGRSFRMTAGYEIGAVACADHYYTVVFFPPGWTCSYDDLANLEYPVFTYSNSPTGSMYDTLVFEEARAMGIWVRYK